MGDSLDHVSSVVDRSSTEFSGGGAVGGTPPPQVSPVGSAGSKVSKKNLSVEKPLLEAKVQNSWLPKLWLDLCRSRGIYLLISNTTCLNRNLDFCYSRHSTL